MDIPLPEDEVVKPLWLSYKKTPQFHQGLTKAVPAHHPLVEKQEKLGLTAIYISFIKILNSAQNARDELKTRTIGDWLNEWKQMHNILFAHVLKNRGDWRKKDIRFGSPGDEELYHIPHWTEVPREMNGLVSRVRELINEERSENKYKYLVLAQVHYQFIRIHPFEDGNGRIARVITDILSIYFGFPPAMAGYPRHDEKRREHYHKAIRSCVEDPSCSELALWIAGYIEEQLGLLA